MTPWITSFQIAVIIIVLAAIIFWLLKKWLFFCAKRFDKPMFVFMSPFIFTAMVFLTILIHDNIDWV